MHIRSTHYQRTRTPWLTSAGRSAVVLWLTVLVGLSAYVICRGLQ